MRCNSFCKLYPILYLLDESYVIALQEYTSCLPDWQRNYQGHLSTYQALFEVLHLSSRLLQHHQLQGS